MTELLRLPVGVESFAEIQRSEFYYVDKTGLIEQLLNQWGKTNLFTRPRRFGKSLTMSMLEAFFEIGTDKTLFDGLYISKNQTLCEQFMGQFPVILITLKNIEARSYEAAKLSMKDLIGTEARRFYFLLNSEKLTKEEQDSYYALIVSESDGSFQMSDAALEKSLFRLTELLEKHFEKKVVLLIDEYDVPLEKAFLNGYYDEMIMLLRNMLGNALKTNSHLQFAVLTGCLRIAKESIFTGLNNFKVYPLTDTSFDEYFGFTDTEVRELLHYYGQDKNYEAVKEWYDGYRFGNVEVYCPWDVINYCSDCQFNPQKQPQNYWANTSGNAIMYRFMEGIGEEQKLTKVELERLIAGETIQKEINQELTYKDLYTSMENLWSTLFMTGYLTQRGEADGNRYNLAVPNREIRNIMTEHIRKLFKEHVAKDGAMVNAFCRALFEGKPDAVETLFEEYMAKTVSVRDTFVRKPIKENFYHGLLLGILSYKGDWFVTSNREAGNGFSDIQIQIDEENVGIIIEVKYAQNGDEEKACRQALKQIQEKEYEASLQQAGIHRILKYGIACNKKKCRVLLEQ